ncbi:MAG: fibronectin type III domain-containing protein [Actinomycetia bacterium]|nr:fibronectin type III domain-containing protein [Actinomycetes bacterium]
MKPSIKRAGGVLAAILAISFGAVPAAQADTATLSPLSGTAAIDGGGLRDIALDTGFNLSLTPGAHCSGNAAGGYVVRSYFIGSGVTLSSVNFGATGLPLPQSGTGSGSTFVSTQPNVSGAAFSVNPGSSAPFLVTGLPQLSLYRMVNKPAITAGAYHLGIACVNTATNTVDGANFWDTVVTISAQTATQFSWQFGSAPTGAAISGSAGDAQVTLDYTIPTSTPAITSATITYGSGPTTITLAGGQLTPGVHTGLNVGSLTNGTAYTFTLTASNGVAPASTANVTLTPSLSTLNNISGLTVTNVAATSATVSWSAPAANGGGQVPTGYLVTVTVTGSGAPAPFTVATTSTPLSGLTAETAYSVTVTAQYSQANPVAAAPSASFTTTPNTIIYQDISVNRPNGLLVMTQRCVSTSPGVGQTINGSIPAEGAQIGFPTGIPATSATSTASIPGGPGDNGVAPAASNVPFATTPPDGTFTANISLLSGYPYPQNTDGTPQAPAYPTRCTINLGNASLVTTGANAGQYFVVSGQIDQVTVVNTQDNDAGWHVTGTMSNFQNTLQTGANTSFSADYLGWTPKRSYITPPQNDGLGANYTMAVTAGTGTTQGTAGGLSNGDVLATSPATQSLGITQLDARLKLLIPTQIKSGTYHGTLTFSALNGA